MTDERHYSLLRHNTFGIDAKCMRYLEYASAEEAVAIAAILRQEGVPFLIIGAGSNLLLTHDYEGIVVRSVIKGISMTTARQDATSLLRCGSGEAWDSVVEWTTAMGYGDLVNLSLIPGDVGASAVQNIGAYGAEASQFIHEIQAVEIATGQRVVIRQEACNYGYRQSSFKQDWHNRYLITHVSYRLHRKAMLNLAYGNISDELQRRGIGSPTPKQLRQVIIDIRRNKLPDPAETGNAGSFFMNPVVEKAKYEELSTHYPQMPHYYVSESEEKIPAGWLIDQCGWKGRSMGRAGVHDKQALVLVNRGGATGSEVVALCQAIQHDVWEKFGITLKPEVNIV